MTSRAVAPLAALLALLGAAPASAAPCVAGPLSSYLALGAGGCTVGAATFEGFGVLAVPFGATPLSPDAVLVVPLASDPATATLTFQVDVAAAVGELLEILVAYGVSAPAGLLGAEVGLAGSSVTEDGANTAVLDLCLGGSFEPGGPTGCTGTPEVLIAFDVGIDQELAASLAFAPVGSIAVVSDVAVDGGILGAAALAAASNRFHLVPEPARVVLLAAGLLAGWRRARAAASPRRTHACDDSCSARPLRS